jgi:hypothetical protein
VGHLTKPFSERGLVEVVRAALGGRLDSAPEVDHYALPILIEQLVRDGRVEREITRLSGRRPVSPNPAAAPGSSRFSACLRAP